MEIFVLVKQVPDTATRIRIADGGKDIDRQGVNMITNPYDEIAIEEGIRQREKHGGKVTLLTIGPASAEDELRKGLAMGADEAVRIDPGQTTLDPSMAARALAAHLGQQTVDLVLAGKQAVDDDQAQVGPRVAELLGAAQVSVVVELTIEGPGGTAMREVEGGLQKVDFSLPAVVTAQKGLNEPRYTSLPGIMKAKRKEIPVIALGTLGVPVEMELEVTALSMPAGRDVGKILSGLSARDAAKELVRLLHEEAKLV